jgi:hypothetical protein
MPAIVTLATQSHFFVELSKVREGLAEIETFTSSLTTSGLSEIAYFVRENNRTYTPGACVFRTDLQKPLLSNTESEEFVEMMQEALLMDERKALWAGKEFVPRIQSDIIDDWSKTMIELQAFKARNIFEIVHTLRSAKMFKKKFIVPKNFKEAFPTLDKCIVKWELPVFPQTPTSPRSPTSPETSFNTWDPTVRSMVSEGGVTTFRHGVNPNYIPKWEEIKDEEIKRCIETLPKENRKIWNASEAVRVKNMTRMKRLKTHYIEVNYFKSHLDRKRGVEMAQLAGPVYRELKKKW